LNDIVFTFDTSKKEKILQDVVELLKNYLESTNNYGSLNNSRMSRRTDRNEKNI